MSDHDLILAIDQGGQSTRAMAFDTQGRVHSAKQVSVTTQYGDDNHIEHDPQELLASAREAISAVTGEVAQQSHRLVAAGLATQRSTVACWDRSTGTALSPVISWQDTRASKLLQQCAPPEADVRKITGLVRSPHYGASKLRWCLDNIPAVQRARETATLAMGPLASFLLFHLLQHNPLFADPVNASRTLLWDIDKLDWSDELLRAFRIPREALPVCVRNRHAFGRLNDNGVPMRVCTGDQNAAIFAGGPVEHGTAYVNIGTGAFVLARSERPPGDTRLLRSVTWSDSDTALRILEGTVNGAGSAVANLQVPEDAVRAAATAIASPDVPLFLNGVSGLGSPFWREDFASRFVGDANAATKLIAVLESVLFLLQVNLNQIAASSNLQSIRISGGLAQSDGVCQGLADLSGLAVVRPEEAEATARGLAFLTAGMPSQWRPAPGRTFAPAEDRSRLRWRFSRWLEAMNNSLT